MSSESTESSESRLARLHAIIESCGECDLAKTRIRAVPGSGPAHARVMFIGEAPGAEEDKRGIPFVGAAGRLLDELLASIELPREAVFITNTVKCRPPGNRVPSPEETAACRDYLKLQVSLIQPRIVCTLGGPALKAVTGETHYISEAHGRAIERRRFTLIPLYHPAAALHKPDLRDTLFRDMTVLKTRLESPQ